jgi:HlyD family secretion protein
LSSQIVKFDVKAGDRVKKGDVLAVLDTADLQILLKKIKSRYERSLSLYKNGHFAKLDLEVLQAEKDDTELRLSWSTVAAPMDGVVLAKYKECGEWVSQGGGLVAIANLKNMKAIFYIEHDKVANLTIGAGANCFLPENPGRIFHGKIAVISSEPEFTPKNVQTRNERTRLVYAVQVDFDNEDELLKPGMTIETSF